MISKLIKRLFKNQLLTSYFRSLYIESLTEISPESNIAEAQPINCRKSSFKSPRLNLLVPALSVQHVFGGIGTALTFFESLGSGMENLRIILTEQTSFFPKDNPTYDHWNIATLEDKDCPGLTIVAAGDRYGRTLSVGSNDRFVATAWWTAVSAKHIQKWQAAIYKLNEAEKFVYLIQDFEPGFYKWSSRYALAESTYHDTNHFIAVFNSSLLDSFFATEQYKFPYTYVFEPTLHPKLREELIRGRTIKKERRVLVYGRPSFERNAFQIIVMSLMEWVSSNPESDWDFVSVGEKHPPVELGGGKYLTSLGKLSLTDYATELSSASVGISLMISPHPSYPPLEMAAFGIRTITNCFKGKDLSLLTPKIISIRKLNPSVLTAALDDCMRTPACTQPSELIDAGSSAWVNYLESNVGFEIICNKILPLLFRNSVSPARELDSNFSYMDFNIPVDLVNMTGGGPDTFEQISKGHISYLNEHIGISSTDNIIEIGCGIGRDAIPLTQILQNNGAYLGIDIIGRSIEWCSNNITPRYPNFKFVHFDVEDQLHNPTGSQNQKDIPIPMQDNKADLIILWSVLTHLFEEDIIHYFREFSRILKPNGLVVASCFAVDENILEVAKTVNLTQHNLRFEHLYKPGCYINDPVVPAGAVAYTHDKFSDIIQKGGLKADRPLLTGQWWGNNEGKGYGQDMLVLRRSDV